MIKKAKHIASKTALVFPLRSADQAFLMALCLVTSIPVLLGKTPAPGTVEAAMPPWMVLGWSVVLVLGAGTVLGSYLVGDRILAIIIEQFGSVCLGVAALLYGGVVFALTFKNGGGIPGTIILGFALARFYQAYQYQKFLDQVEEVLNKLEGGTKTDEL